MKHHRLRTLFSLMAALGFTASLGLTGCDVEVEDDGELPTVDIDPGEAPDVDVKGPEIETETREVEVPVGIDIPEDGEAAAEDTD